MNPLRSWSDSGCDSIVPSSEENSSPALPDSPLREAVRTGPPEAVEAAIRHLASRANACPLTSAEVAAALLAPHGAGDSTLHVACQSDRRPGVLEALLRGIEVLAMTRRIESRELAVMLRAVDQEGASAMQLLAGTPNPSGLRQFGDMLIRLRDRGDLSDPDLAALLLQRSHDETPLQLALRRGGPAAVETMLQLWAQALSRQVIDARDVTLALGASRLPDPPSRRGVASGSRLPPPLIQPFASAHEPGIRALLRGIEALRDTRRLPDELLRAALSPAFAATNSGVRDCPAMRAERRQAQALVDAARARWGI